MKRLILPLLLSLSGVFSPALADTRTVEVVIDQSREAVDVFFRIPSGLLTSELGAADLLDPSATIIVDELVATPFLPADRILPGFDLRVNGVVGGFEAMSMVIHGADVPLAFDTPVDATIATSVCTLPPRAIPVADTITYLSANAYPLAPDSVVTFALPGGAEEVRLRRFVGGTLVEDRSEARTDQRMSVALTAPARDLTLWAWMFGGVVLVAGLWGLARRVGRGPQSPRP